MTEQEKLNKYMREWRARNREKYNAYQRKYRKDAPSDAKWREEERIRVRKYKKEHREEILSKEREAARKRYRRDVEYSKKKNKESYQRNADKRRREARERRAKNKLLVINHYTNDDPKCACCANRYLPFLTIDHIAGHGREHRKSLAGPSGSTSSHTVINWIIKNNFPPGFQILCQNCNSAKGSDEICSCSFEQQFPNSLFLS